MKSEDTLFNPDQIHLLSHAIRPTVRVDFERGTMYGDAKKARDEAERVRVAQKVLMQLAEAGKLTEGESITPLKRPMTSMSELREALFKTYKALEPSGDYKSFFWKGICRPILGISWEDKVAVKKYSGNGGRNFVCERCKPGEVISLPVPSKVTANVLSRHPNMKDFIPDDHLLPLKDWVVPGPDGKVYTPGDQWPPQETVKGTWKKVSEMSVEELSCKARREGLDITNIRWDPANLLNRRLNCFSPSDVAAGNLMGDEMDRHISRWRVVNLADLIKSYRLSPDIVRHLEDDANMITDACDKFGPRLRYDHYIGNYAQAYVLLQFTERGERSRLRLVTIPWCLANGVELRTLGAGVAFWDQVRADAGCDDVIDYLDYSAVKDGVGNSSK
ncbi:hypothetical protein GNI_174420 [Gregarina niphandrodes]|uniref:Uncharacterized protein n=1 Tax=Gregarina niphandrodes TaxID=110365 RepID=A0A023AY85_GRENI|nr:hypothetical protein GNI_174420 [Gregarina niphandrodes]EZG43388.1 hypothetical protein GNI_174420 [Gregarina niphandrodes]|eukprot:XP_011133381.1 hypothetical protein GNI_174420 [Gregarina niphandrodes]